MVNISACVVVKNEARNIQKWLLNTARVSFEQIVIDTGSTDDTVDLAKTAGAEVYEFNWKNDFSAAKNFALEKAKGDWILFLDADEYFTEKSLQDLHNCLDEVDRNQNIDGLVCHLLNIDQDENDRLINTTVQMRLFRNRKYLRYEGKIHEHVVNHVKKNLNSKFVDLEIIHTGYTKSIVKGKLRRNLEMIKADIELEGEKPEQYGYLISCYFGLGQYDKAIEYAEIAIKNPMPLMGQEKNIYRNWIDSCVLGKREIQDTLEIIETAMLKFPNMPEFIWNKGELLFQQGNYISAEKYIRESLALQEKQKDNNSVLHSSVFEAQLFFVYYRLGTIFNIKGDFIGATEMFIRSLRLFKYDEHAFNELYSLIKNEDIVEVVELFDTLYEKNTHEQKFLLEMLRKNQAKKAYIYYSHRFLAGFNKSDVDQYFATDNFKAAFTLLEEQLTMRYYEFLIETVIAKEERPELEVVLSSVYLEVLHKLQGITEKHLTISAQLIAEEIEDVLENIRNKQGKQ